MTLIAYFNMVRCINVHGVKGRNISFDLHLEHLNQLYKESIKDLGANKTSEGIVRASYYV